MKTKAVRLYGENDLRLEEFELPQIKDNEILAQVISDSICMSSYKATKQGIKHKRVPDNAADNPVMIGHEFCGKIIEVGSKWKDKFTPGNKFSIQPALNYENGPVGILSAPGYSYNYIGGDATYIIIPNEVMEQNCLLEYNGPGYFPASLSEPMSCIVGAYHANFHVKTGTYVHNMGIKEKGNLAILAGVGPMGLGAIDYALHCDRKPGKIVVTDIDQTRLDRAQSLFPVEDAQKSDIELLFINTKEMSEPQAELLKLTDDQGFDDVFVFAPVAPVIELGDKILARDGCLNFFAGPTNPEFTASFNFYNVHYNSTHIIGTSGGNFDDMKESLHMMAEGLVDPSVMITHVGGLNAVIETTKNLPNIPGGKKLIYTNIDMELTAITDFQEKGKSDPLFQKLAEICQNHNGLWSVEAEEYLLTNAKA